MMESTEDLMMESTWMAADQLTPAPWNFKTDGDAELRERFTRSLQHGVTPLHVAECVENLGVIEVCDGNHRLVALLALGITNVAVFDHGPLSLAERQAIGVRYNGRWFTEETLPLAECLQNIDTELPELSDSFAYSSVEFNRMLATLNVDLDATSVDPPDIPASEPAPSREKKIKTVECPHCGKEFNL